MFPSEIKKYINTFLCPICNCGLDGTPWQSIDGYNQVALYCAYDRFHFIKELGWYSLEIPTTVNHIRDVLILYANANRYTIEKRYLENKVYHTRLYLLKVDAEGRSPEGKIGSQITIEGDLFDFNLFNREECLDRINTIIMFQ